ncbi:hypothetical protein CHUAL_000670 [Chamberlinius hualienensis]
MAEQQLDTKIVEIMKLSKEMKEKAYCPYSKYRVGVALLTQNGTIYTGCNVENASYGLSICAERVALVKAVSEGQKHFTALAVSTDDDDPRPCGACRQFMTEFGVDWDVYMTNSDLSYKKLTTGQLLPLAFTPQRLI